MNKLILIGNGFDLAHDLSTSYNHFINNFWANLHLKFKEDFIKKFVCVPEEYSGLFNYKENADDFTGFWENIKEYSSNRRFFLDNKAYTLKSSNSGNKFAFEFKNIFFKEICVSQKNFNWVDVENEYYKKVKIISKINIAGLKGEDITRERIKQLLKLNHEFDQVKELLKNYLLSEIHKKYNFSNINTHTAYSKLLKLFNSNNFFIDNPVNPHVKSQIEKYSKEFSLKEDKEEILRIIEDFKEDQNSVIKYNTLALDFNYTSTFYLYNQKLESQINEHSWIKIHGDLNQPIFGFGDETDKDYQEIENIGDNEYLKNFKSFQYSNTDNYDKLLEYIESEKFQVYIMGHSCGLSDRVLLNTIFEHENCRSIKIFYHDEKEKDNYTYIVQNISRHFKNKASMRTKIVNKTLCEPLPQDVRFMKKE